jgi:ABC-2 type transport system ATP-binding protein
MSVLRTQLLTEAESSRPRQLAIEATGLSKAYGANRVLDGVNLDVERGQLLVLLGPNGAGKTTTVRILATLLAPDAGRARVAGYDVVAERRQVRSRISLTGQFAALDERQTGRENLEMIARLRQIPSREARSIAEELLVRFDLRDSADRTVAGYSGGMRRRLDLAAGLIGHPSVVFLDEPTTGLDPRARQAMWEIIRGLVQDGVSVLLTTQYLDEADALADRVVILDSGRVVADGSAAELKQRFAAERMDIQLVDETALADALALLGKRALQTTHDELTISVAVHGGATEIRRLLDTLDPQQQRITRFSLHQTTLDDAFMALTGHTTGVAA